jgi:hypothetical protein
MRYSAKMLLPAFQVQRNRILNRSLEVSMEERSDLLRNLAKISGRCLQKTLWTGETCRPVGVWAFAKSPQLRPGALEEVDDAL